MDDDVVIRVGPYQTETPLNRSSIYDLGGWESVRIQRSCEFFPSVFEIVATERYPSATIDVPVRPGDPCQVFITRGLGRDLVVSGYIDSVTPGLSASQHSLRIVGRGRGQDLVDCSAVWSTGQFNNQSVLTIAQSLAKPFGISVSQLSGEERVVPQLVIMWGETPYELIERIARFAALLVYEDANGNLVLSRVGNGSMSTGVVEGANIQQASVQYSMHDRYSQYRVRRLTFSPFADGGANPEGDIVATIQDGGVPRFRPKYIIAETPAGMGDDYARARGEWEASRRFGRSTQIHVTVDSWRDGSGNLWTPNTIIPIRIPTLKVNAAAASQTEWVIGSVMFRRDERGTAAELTVMPAAAFDVLPVPITPLLNAGPY